MIQFNSRSTLAVALTFLALSIPARAQAPFDLMASGVILGRDLFNNFREGPKPIPGEDGYSGPVMQRLVLDWNGAQTSNLVEYAIPFTPQWGERSWVPRIKIDHNQIYVSVPAELYFHRIPLEDIQLYENSDLAVRLWKKRTGGFQRHLGLPGQSREIRLLVQNPRLFEESDDPTFDPRSVPYDLWPLDNPRWVRAFCNHKGTMYGIDLHWQRTEKNFPPDDEKAWRVGDGRQNLREVKANFEGDFTVYRVGKVYYFLADTGKLYMLPDDPKAKELTEVTVDPKRRLLGCIQDVDGKTVYAIVRGEGGKRSWFELSEKPVLHDYERTAESLKAYPRRDEIPDAWRTIREHLKKTAVPKGK